MYDRTRAFFGAELNRRAHLLAATADSTARHLRGLADGFRADGLTRALAPPTERLAASVERAARYVEARDAVVLAEELRAVGRRRPWAFALAGFAGGFAAVRLLRVVNARERPGEETPEPDDARAR